MDEKYTVIDTGIIPKFLTNGNGSLSEIYQKKSKGTGIVAGAAVISLVGVSGWAFVKFALPLIMTMISPVIAGILSFFAVMFAFTMVKPVWKWFRAISNKVYKAAIRYNPEIAVENKINSFTEMSELFRNALSEVKKASAQFKEMATKSEKEIEDKKTGLEKNRQKLIQLKKEESELKTKVNSMKAEINNGKRRTQKERQPYYDALEELTRVTKEIDRISSDSHSDQTILEMNMDLVKKYAAKAHIFADWISFLDRGADQIDNKKRELSVWWEAIKKEINVANAGKDATNALQFILRDVNGNQYDFNLATEYIIDKINSDYSITVQNMSDLKRHVAGLDFNSEEAFDDLEKLLNDLETGEKLIPSALEISSPAHKLSSDERSAAGVLGNLFDD
jgi:chromosome segregation ATPase